VGALDEETHHQGEDDVCGEDRTATAENPVEAAAEEERDGSADQGPAEKAHRGAGEIELTCVSGEHHSFRCGDILSFARIALGSVHNAQSTPARVLAIWRRATPDSAPVSFRAPGRHTEKDPDLD